MKRAFAFLAGLALLFSLQAPALAQEETIHKTKLKVGDTAPDFTMMSNARKQVKLSDYRGKKNVILAFYVLAFTGG